MRNLKLRGSKIVYRNENNIYMTQKERPKR